MIYLDLPNIGSGTVEQQLSEIRSYIYKSNEQMNAALGNFTTEKFWENTAAVMTATGASSDYEIPQLLNQYSKIRNLIIKTAGEVIKTEENFNLLLSGGYVATSQFGKYLLETSVDVEGTSTGFIELYNYTAKIDSDFGDYRLEESNYIKRGLLDGTVTPPVYGIELGILKKEITDGDTVITLSDTYRTRITPSRWSFIHNGSTNTDSEVAYIESDMIYFPQATIHGGTIDIGNGNFVVNNKGEMTAKKGTFYGTIAANALTTSLNAWSNNVKIKPSEISFISGSGTSAEKNLSIQPRGIEFYRLDNDSENAVSTIYKSTYGATCGLTIDIKSPIATYFSLSENNTTRAAFVTYSSVGGSTPPYGGVYGFHFSCPVDFHDQVLSNVLINNLKIFDGGSAYTGVTGNYIVKLAHKNSDGSYTEYYSDLFIKNGIIVGIT